MTPSLPRLLVTGFGPFPGAPENPTQWLIETLHDHPGTAQFGERLRLEVLPVEYEAAATRLARLGEEFAPDIAIHFGLAQPASGFRLERKAENRVVSDRPDQSGALPASDVIVPDAPDLPTRLPLDKIAAALEAEGLPVEWSDDAGGYLCNYVFYLVCSETLCTSLRPQMAGFVHVPLLNRQLPPGQQLQSLREEELLRGALIILSVCENEWCSAATQGINGVTGKDAALN